MGAGSREQRLWWERLAVGWWFAVVAKGADAFEVRPLSGVRFPEDSGSAVSWVPSEGLRSVLQAVKIGVGVVSHSNEQPRRSSSNFAASGVLPRIHRIIGAGLVQDQKPPIFSQTAPAVK